MDETTRPLVCLEKRRFPGRQGAIDAVRDVWKDRHVRVEAETEQAWTLRVLPGWPMSPFPDPSAEAVARDAFGVEPGMTHAFRRLERWADGRHFLVCMDHCWALWAWSRALGDPTRDVVTLVHLDAHEDLESPPLVCTDVAGCFRAPVGAERLDLRRAETVQRVVHDGFVGIGGFIVPLLHANPNVDLVHVEPAGAERRGARMGRLKPTRVVRQTFAGAQARPAVAPDPTEGRLHVRTDDLDDLLRLEPRGRVLLDIDMDFFCNRWEGSGEASGVSSDIATAIDRVADRLEEAAWRDRVVAATVALSPGFFPAEHWVAALSRLETRLRALLAGRKKGSDPFFLFGDRTE